MTPPKKKESFYKRKIAPAIGPSMLILLITTVVGWYITSERNKDAQQITTDSIEERIPNTVTEFVEWEDHMNEKPSDVDNYKREIRLIKQGDTLLQYQSALDSAQIRIEKNIKVIDEFFEFAKEKHISDSIKDIKKQKSRDDRTEEIQNIGNILRVMQLKDTIN